MTLEKNAVDSHIALVDHFASAAAVNESRMKRFHYPQRTHDNVHMR